MDADLAKRRARLYSLLPDSLSEVGHRVLANAQQAATRLGLVSSHGGLSTERLLNDLVLPPLIDPAWPGPAPPTPVGGGWVQADITDDDIDTFDRLRSTLIDPTPVELATAAQSWRLPVVPYLPAPPACFADPTRHSSANNHSGADNHSGATKHSGATNQSVSRSSLGGLRVLDLSSLWAGPLCARLLADLGASVVKVDPDCRPDGFRERAELYAELNDGKQIISLDLRRRDDRAVFEDYLDHSDVLISSFSRRVLPNLGYDPAALLARHPRLAIVSIVGFAASSPYSDWLTYGTGIHAMSGLGLLTGVAKAPPVAYPDPLAGYTAFGAILDLLAAGGGWQEVSLAEVGSQVAA